MRILCIRLHTAVNRPRWCNANQKIPLVLCRPSCVCDDPAWGINPSSESSLYVFISVHHPYLSSSQCIIAICLHLCLLSDCINTVHVLTSACLLLASISYAINSVCIPISSVPEVYSEACMIPDCISPHHFMLFDCCNTRCVCFSILSMHECHMTLDLSLSSVPGSARFRRM